MNAKTLNEERPARARLVLFFTLVFALSIPFWVLSAAHPVELMPGLPLASLMFVCPLVAALILTTIAGGAGAARALLARSFDGVRAPSWKWFVPIVLANPILFGAALAIQRAAGASIPPLEIQFVPTALMAVMFFVAALGEELGWSGYAIEPLQRRVGFVAGSLLLGGVWAAWHFAALIQVGRSLEWIAWWSLGTVAARVIMVWLFNRTGGSVFGAALYHAISNVCWQLYPVHGSYFDPRLTGSMTSLLAATLLVGHALTTSRPRT